jgi:transcriptional regulator with XRE-family HTH domain
VKQTDAMAENNHSQLREWLLAKLAERDMSVAELAKATGVSRAAIYLYLNDQSRPSGYHMARMCQVLGVPIREGLEAYVDKQRGRPRLLGFWAAGPNRRPARR